MFCIVVRSLVTLLAFEMRFCYMYNHTNVFVTHLCTKLSLKWLNRYFPWTLFVMMCEVLKNRIFYMWVLKRECEPLVPLTKLRFKCFCIDKTVYFSWVMKLWMAQTWFCNICTFYVGTLCGLRQGWCSYSRIQSHIWQYSCKIRKRVLINWILHSPPLTRNYIPTERMFIESGFVIRKMFSL